MNEQLRKSKSIKSSISSKPEVLPWNRDAEAAQNAFLHVDGKLQASESIGSQFKIVQFDVSLPRGDLEGVLVQVLYVVAKVLGNQVDKKLLYHLRRLVLSLFSIQCTNSA